MHIDNQRPRRKDRRDEALDYRPQGTRKNAGGKRRLGRFEDFDDYQVPKRHWQDWLDD